jgi:hypothetical protein
MSTPSSEFSNRLQGYLKKQGQEETLPAMKRDVSAEDDDSDSGRPIEEPKPKREKSGAVKLTKAQYLKAEKIFMEIQNLNKIPPNLKTLTTFACVFQCIQALLLFIVTARIDGRQFFWFTNYPNGDVAVPVPKANLIASFSIMWYSPVFILLSGLDHMICLIFRKTYVWYIQRNQNPFRYIEYSFSASLMRIYIAQLAGITDVHLLVSIFCMTAFTMQLGLLH